MIKNIYCLLIGMFMLLFGCATMNSKENPKMINDMGLVYIIHTDTSSADFLVKEHVLVNGQLQSKTKAGSFSYFYAKPGVYKISNIGKAFLGVNSDLANSFEVKIEVGKKYFLNFEIEKEITKEAHTEITRTLLKGTKWIELDEMKGKELINRMKCVKPIKENF